MRLARDSDPRRFAVAAAMFAGVYVATLFSGLSLAAGVVAFVCFGAVVLVASAVIELPPWKGSASHLRLMPIVGVLVAVGFAVVGSVVYAALG